MIITLRTCSQHINAALGCGLTSRYQFQWTFLIAKSILFIKNFYGTVFIFSYAAKSNMTALSSLTK